MVRFLASMSLFVVTIGLLEGCGQGSAQSTTAPAQTPDPSHVAAEAKVAPSRAATTQPSNNNVVGVVYFTQVGDDALVVAEITGLTPGKHGFHIHESGDLSDPQLKSAGDHYNPSGHKHGGHDSEARHAGDLGNLDADASSKASYSQTIKGLKISDIIGRSVIVHATEDDLKTDPSGNSGGRIAGGVIEKK